MTDHEKPALITSQDHEQRSDAADSHDFASLRERHPDWPDIDLSFYFAPHGNYEDMKGLESHIRENDVFLYEDVAQSAQKKASFNQIANYGALSVEDILDATATAKGSTRGTHMEAIVRGLHDSSTVAASIDIGRNDYEKRLGSEIMRSLGAYMPKGLNLEDSIAYLHQNSAHIAELMNEREDIMVGNFEQEIEKILAEHPELKDKKELKVLLSMGVYHTRLRREFARGGMRSETYFSAESPYVYSYSHELMRSYAFDKEPSDELAARALAEGILRRAIKIRKSDKQIANDERIAYIRRYVSVLSKDEISTLLDMWNSNQATADNIDALLVPVEMPPLPRSNADILRKNREYEQHSKTLGASAVDIAND